VKSSALEKVLGNSKETAFYLKQDVKKLQVLIGFFITTLNYKNKSGLKRSAIELTTTKTEKKIGLSPSNWLSSSDRSQFCGSFSP
jgi:hypothetical protein